MQKKKETLKEFMEDYTEFNFNSGTIVLFDADSCGHYLLDTDQQKMMYLTEERLAKSVYNWKNTDRIITIVIRENNSDSIQHDETATELQQYKAFAAELKEYFYSRDYTTAAYIQTLFDNYGLRQNA